MGFRKAREAASLTLIEAAEKIGVKFQAVSQWEHGITMPSATRLPRIAEVYGCTVDELLKED